MHVSKPRGPRIVYVAASARELPEEVQQWLGRPENRAASSPHIYDALARLATGARPAVLIVSLEAVDWSEMGFFDQAARLSRETQIYVTGHSHLAAKLEAACKRGALLFDEDAIRETLASPPQWSRGPGFSDILAANIAPKTSSVPPPPALFRPVPAEPLEPEELEEEPESPELLVEEPLAEPEPEPQAQQAEPEPKPEVAPAPPLPVRLVDPAESEVADEETSQPIPFPWSPSPNRPKRVPPKAYPAGIEPTAPAPAAPVAPPPPPVPGIAATVQPPPVPTPPPLPRQSVELTADELAALMGRPISPEKTAKEGTG